MRKSTNHIAAQEHRMILIGVGLFAIILTLAGTLAFRDMLRGTIEIGIVRVKAELNLPITVKEAAGTGASGYPTTVIVPLAKGQYRTVAPFRLLDGSGAEAPAQIQILNRWHDRSIRHLKIEFQATVSAYTGSPDSGIARYYLRDDNGGRGEGGTPLAVDDSSDPERISVVTGPLKFTVRKRSGFTVFDDVWLDENGDGAFSEAERVIEARQENGGTLLGANFDRSNLASGGRWNGSPNRLSDDAERDSARDRSNGLTVTVEERGPMRAVLRAEAPALFTPRPDPSHLQGQTHGFAVRIYAYAGKPYVKVDYQLQNSAKCKEGASITNGACGRNDQIQRAWAMYFEKMNMEFALRLDAASRRVRFGTANASVELANPSGYLAQDVTEGSPNTNRQFRYRVFGSLSGGASLASGEKSDGWIDIRDASRGVSAITRNFWQTWPNGLAYDGNTLILQLWPEWSAQWDEDMQISPTGLYWFADMQHVVKETMFFFHGPGVADREIANLAKTFQYRPVAVLPASHYRETRATLDLGGLIPPTQPEEGGRVPVYTSAEGDESQKSTYIFGWGNFSGDPDRRQARAAGGFAYAGSSFIETENPRDYFDAEDHAFGELNVRPQWMAQYEFPRDGYLGLTQSYDGHSWRRNGGASDKNEFNYIPGTDFAYDARDDQHGWFYHAEDAYYFTGNRWIYDWYAFIKGFREPGLGNVPEVGTPLRNHAHFLANTLAAYRVAGDLDGSYLRAIKNFVTRNLRQNQSPVYGVHQYDPRPGVTTSSVSGFEIGYLANAVIQALTEFEGDPQAYAEGFNYLSGLMESNANFVRFGFQALLGHEELETRPGPECSSGTAHTLTGPYAWYYLNTGKSPYLNQLQTYLSSGFAGFNFDDVRYRREQGAAPPYYEPCGPSRPYNDPSNWRGNWRQRWLGRGPEYIAAFSRPDAVAPQRVTDLAASLSGSSVTLSWTAPPDADIRGGRYHIVWADRPITEVTTADASTRNWWAANAVGPSLTPRPGSRQSVTIRPSSLPIYAALFTFDERGNMSAMSNVAFSVASQYRAEFNSSPDGWEGYDIAPFVVGRGSLEVRLTGNDPQLVSPSFAVDGSQNGALLIRAKRRGATAGRQVGQIFFQTARDSSWSEERSVTVEVPELRDEFHTYVINMERAPGWVNNIITRLRIDPPADLDIDYVRVIRPAPSAPSHIVSTAVSATEVEVMWEDTSFREEGFKVWVRRAGNSRFNLFTTLPPNSQAAHIPSLQPATTYEVRITAFNRFDSVDSEIVRVTTEETPLPQGAPTPPPSPPAPPPPAPPSSSAPHVPDFIPPDAVILSPANGAELTRGATYKIVVRATDRQSEVLRVEMYQNERLYCIDTTPAEGSQYECEGVAPKTGPASRVIVVQAVDGRGNIGTASITITLR